MDNNPWLDVKVSSPPTGEVIPLAEAKEWLQVTHDYEDNVIRSLLRAIVERIDGKQYGFALLRQVWTKEIRCLSQRIDEVVLPGFPDLELVGVFFTTVYRPSEDDYVEVPPDKYIVSAGADQIIVSMVGDWSDGEDVDIMSPGRLRFDYRVGWNSASDIPEDLRAAIKFALAYWYDDRDGERDLPRATRHILDKYNRRFFE